MTDGRGKLRMRRLVSRTRMMVERLAPAIGINRPKKALILLYHRVASPARDPQALAVAPDLFGGHLSVLRDASHVLPLRELVERVIAGRPLPRRPVAITFDDGYTDNLRTAEPLLARAQLPATLFVATGYIETGRPYWWDAVETAILGTPLPERIDLPLPTGSRSWWITDEPVQRDSWNVLSGSAPGSRRAAYSEIMPEVKLLDPPAREAVLGALRRACRSDLAGEPDARPMTPQDVAEMAGRGVIEIGAHTVNHAQLSLLDPFQQREEVAESKRKVAEWTGRAPAAFAYPYGSRADYDADSVAAVKQSGFSIACSNFQGLVDAKTDLFELPRLLVRNLPVDDFERLIDTAFAGDRASA